jgi:hypothetical protein
MKFSQIFLSIPPPHNVCCRGFRVNRGGLSTEATSVGIQKHFMAAEIPGFEFPNRLSDLTTSLFSRDGIGKLVFNKVK